MTHLQVDLAIALFAAHVISDFVLQTDTTIKAKKRVRVLVGHCLIVALLSYLLAGMWEVWLIPVAVFVTHLLMDFVKSRWLSERLQSFAIDQAVHLAIIAALVFAVPRMVGPDQTMLWQDAVSPRFYQWLLGAAGLVAATCAGSVLVSLVIKKFQQQPAKQKGAPPPPASDREGLDKGGKWIGLLERALIFVLVAAGQPAAIGFLIAAKSILRFGEIGKGADRKDVEYIIVGTLTSFLVALVVSYLTRLGFLEYGASWLTN